MKLAFEAGGLLRFLRAACFEARTQVVVGINDDGTFQLRNIEEIRVGDVVLTKDQYDPAGELVEGRVSQVFQTTAYGVHILELTDEETGNVETIKATAEHPFYVEGQGWLAAEHLSLGMRVQNPDGTWSVVSGNTYEAREAGVTVYNFEVEGGHTYFVADDQGDVSAVWVHNTCTRRGVTRRNARAWRTLRDSWDANGYGHILSEANKKLIARGKNPIVDAKWVDAFPGDARLVGEQIRLHDIGGFPITIPPPETRHLAAHLPGGFRCNFGGPGIPA